MTRSTRLENCRTTRQLLKDEIFKLSNSRKPQPRKRRNYKPKPRNTRKTNLGLGNGIDKFYLYFLDIIQKIFDDVTKFIIGEKRSGEDRRVKKSKRKYTRRKTTFLEMR